MKAKIGSPAAKLTAKKAVELGIIDSAHHSVEETMKAAIELGEGLVKKGFLYLFRLLGISHDNFESRL